MATEGLTIHRRDLLCATAAALGAALTSRGAFAKNTFGQANGARLLTAARVDGADAGGLWSEEGFFEFALPGRAHAAIRLADSNRFLLAGRRPGAFAALFDAADAERPRLIPPHPWHRFAGHAAALGAGRFVTAELHEETASGIVVLRDAASGEAKDAWSLAGIEPHELLIAGGGERLVVALGGIARDSTIKSQAINAGHIESAIVVLDAGTDGVHRSPRVLNKHVLPPEYASLSMRHLALAPGGETIAIGMQDQDKSRLRPLMGVLHLTRGIELLPLPADDPGALRFYIGSVAIDASGNYVAATSPKGGTLALWSLPAGRYLGRIALADICGLAADRESGFFWATSGAGDVVRVQAGPAGPVIKANWRAAASFDNHLLLI